MKIILRSDVPNLGNKGDIVDVRDGYARNYLVPKGLALLATKGALAQAEAMRAARNRSEERDRGGATELAQRLSDAVVKIPARAGADGRLFGSVTAADIVEAAASQLGVELDRRRLHLEEPLRSLGRHSVAARLHAEVEAQIAVEVTPAG